MGYGCAICLLATSGWLGMMWGLESLRLESL
jgi:hypothetical protein